MELNAPKTKIIGIGDFGRDAIATVKKSWPDFARETIEEELKSGGLAYVNFDSSTDETEINSVFESTDTVLVIADVSVDFELTKKVSEIATAKGLFTVIGLVNGNREKATELTQVSDSAIILPSSDDVCVFRFVETFITPIHVIGIIGIDFEDVKAVFKSAGVGCFSFSDGNDNDVDSIVADCLDKVYDGFEFNTAKSVLINIDMCDVYGMDFMDGVVCGLCERFDDSATVLFTTNLIKNSEDVYVSIIFAEGSGNE